MHSYTQYESSFGGNGLGKDKHKEWSMKGGGLGVTCKQLLKMKL